jgi:hypothetical protein
MRTIDSGSLAVLQAGAYIEREMILFDLASGLYGFWNGIGTFTWNSIPFVGAGSLIRVEESEQNTELQAEEFSLVLREIPNSDLSPDVLSTIENETYKGRPFTGYKAWFDPDTRALLSVEVWTRGIIDTFTHRRSEGVSELVCHIETRAIDYTRRRKRMRTDADQRRIDANDGGLRYVTEEGEIFWGRTAPKKAGAGSAKKG